MTRVSESAMQDFRRRVSLGDLNEATANWRDLTVKCSCGRLMRPTVGRCGTCAAAELKTLGVDALRMGFEVRGGCVERSRP